MIYLDNAATTRIDAEVYEGMQPYLQAEFANPSSVYQFAGGVKQAIAKSRRSCAGLIGAREDEIYFTSGGTEADNWALQGAVDLWEQQNHKEQHAHIITTKIEHPAILQTCAYLERVRKVEVTYLDVDSYGMVDPAEVRAAIRENTCLISVMYANNEIGTVQPVSEIGNIAKEAGILFHTDAVQAYGHLRLDVNAGGIDLLSASAHKLHGPKGCGILYIRKNVTIPALIHGGAQERQRRAGTQNVPAIVGMGKAAALAGRYMEERYGHMKELRDYMEEQLKREIPDCCINGRNRLPGHLNVTFPGVSGESLLILLDMEGIYASAGSACSSGSLDPSHVLLALGKSKKEAFGTLRFTFSHENTKEEANQTVSVLKHAIARLRSMAQKSDL